MVGFRVLGLGFMVWGSKQFELWFSVVFGRVLGFVFEGLGFRVSRLGLVVRVSGLAIVV